MDGQAEETVGLRTWIGVIACMLGAFMAILDIQITNSSLREIAGGISATPAEGSWISTAYLIGEIIAIPLTAWLSRVFSVRLYLLVNIVLFLIFSGLSGISTSLTEIIIFRAGQGFTGGVFIPMALTVMLTTLPKSRHLVGQAIFGITATLAPAIGPVVGGWLTAKFGWEWNFYVNFFPGILMFLGVYFAIKSEPMKMNLLKNGDWLGISCMIIGLSALVTMLEEGQREDWFGSTYITICALVALVFVPAFILTELTRKHPFVNLRLLGTRNLGAASGVGFVLGLALYGSVYLIPLYLGQIHGYNPLQIGEVLIWVGLPQLMVFPFLPFLLKKFDMRLLVAFGCTLFALSCYMNSNMDQNYAGPQFILANILRAVGQPFTIVPVTSLATGMLSREQSGDGSAIFNILRNLGGSVGIAILSTVVTRREQFHDARLGESITAFDPATQIQLRNAAANFMEKGADPNTAMAQAIASLKRLVQVDANIMAFNDAFLFVTYCLLTGVLLVWICKRPKFGKSGMSAH